jgi:hypothetical protein
MGRGHFFFILGGGSFWARENFSSWVFLGEIFGPLGRGFGLGLRQVKKAAIPQEKKGANKDESTNDEPDEKISRSASASHGDLVDVLEITFLGFGKCN